MSRFWMRLPVVLRAIVLGILIQLAGLLWIALLLANARVEPHTPWAAFAMALILLAFWSYAGGVGGPVGTKEFRRTHRRTARLASGVLGLALLAAAFGQASLVALGTAASLYLHLSPPTVPDLSMFSPGALVVLVFAWSLTAGVVEETAFRGYMQSMIERRHGAVVAILITSLVFALAHFSTVAQMLPLIFLASVIYGIVARVTGSIVPGVVVHTVGNFLSFLWAFFHPFPQRANPPAAFDDPVFLIALGVGAVASLAFLVFLRRLRTLLAAKSAPPIHGGI